MNYNVMHCTPGDLGKLSDWKAVISYAATLNQKPLTSGKPVFDMIWISPFCQTTNAFTFNKYPRQGSLYATKDHFKVDSLFSTVADDHPDKQAIDESYLRELCLEGAKKGTRLCADLVINHVASDHPLAIREDLDVKSIQTWGRNVRIVIKDAAGTISERLPGVLHDGESVIALSYDHDGNDTLPGKPDNHGRKTYDLRFVYDGRVSSVIDSSLGQNWSDVRKINYHNPSARAEFCDLWKRQITWLMDLGFTGFRCDAAYKIGSDIWSDLVQHAYDDYAARKKSDITKTFSEPVWVAETLGGDWPDLRKNLGAAKINTKDGTRLAFDYGMLGTYWWNGKDEAYIDQSKVLQETTRFGGLGVADNHDTRETLAAAFAAYCKPESVADICFRDFVQSLVLGSAGVCMELGFEKNLVLQPSIFREPAVFESRQKTMQDRGLDHPMNISRRIHAVIDYMEQMCDVGLSRHFNRADFATSLGTNGQLARYSIDFIDNKTGEKKGTMALLVNTAPERGHDTIHGDQIMDSGEVANRIILGRCDAGAVMEITSHDKSLVKVHDVAIYTNLVKDAPLPKKTPTPSP